MPITRSAPHAHQRRWARFLLSHGAAMTVEHTAMFTIMLAVMLRRRDEFMVHVH